jgi:hypothetical protein
MSLTSFPASVVSPSASNEPECEPPPFVRSMLTAAKCSPDTGLTSPFTTTFASSTAASLPEQLTLFAGDTLASPFQPQVSSKEKPTRATSGRKCTESFEKHAQDGSFARMFADTLASVLTPLPHNWKMTASPSGRLLFQLAPSARRTGETDSGLWATPQARDYFPPHKPEYIAKQKAKGHGMRNLNDEVHLWPTPRANEETGGPSIPPNRQGGMALKTAVLIWPTPTASRRSGLQSHGKNAILGTLNPAWVEAMMGYPPGWTSLTDGQSVLGKTESPALPLASPIVSSD